MQVSIFGAGYVGTVTAACLAASGHTVTLVDIEPSKVELINNGTSHFYENGLDDLLSKVINRKCLKATIDGHAAIVESDMSLICVGTPSDPSGHIDYQFLDSVCVQIGSSLKQKSENHCVVFRSTMLPGTLEERLLPILEKSSGKKCGEGFTFAYNPEFLREGSAISDHHHPTQIVVGADSNATAEMVMKLYDGIDAPRSMVSIREAEAVKYVSNIWRAQKVTFANEMGEVLYDMGVDPHAVISVFFEDRKINMGPAFLQPGFAFGGSCLPKDIRAFASYAKEKELSTPVLHAIKESNKARISKAVEAVKRRQPNHVLMLGVSFKPGTDDLRESPYMMLAKEIQKAGIAVSIYDENIKSIEGYVTLAIELASSSDFDVIILSHDCPGYISIIEKTNEDVFVLTLTRPKNNLAKRNVQGLSW